MPDPISNVDVPPSLVGHGIVIVRGMVIVIEGLYCKKASYTERRKSKEGVRKVLIL